MITLGDIADNLGVSIETGRDVEIVGLAGLSEAGPSDLSFLKKESYASLLKETTAAAVLVGLEWTGDSAVPVIPVADVNKAVVQAASLFAPPPIVYAPGIHASSVVADTAKIDPTAHIGPLCAIDDGVEIGANTVILAGCCIGPDTTIGADCLIYANVSIRERITIGSGVIIHSGVVIGSDGYGFITEMKDGEISITKIPHIGTVEICDNVEIGSNSSIDRARFGVTRIGRNVKIDNLVQIAHNCIIGDNCGLAAQAGAAGSVTLGKGVMLWGQCGVSGHLHVGDGGVVGGRAGVTKDVPAGVFVSGYPAMPHMEAAKNHANVMRIPKLKKRVAQLEKRIAELEAGKEVPE